MEVVVVIGPLRRAAIRHCPGAREAGAALAGEGAHRAAGVGAAYLFARRDGALADADEALGAGSVGSAAGAALSDAAGQATTGVRRARFRVGRERTGICGAWAILHVNVAGLGARTAHLDAGVADGAKAAVFAAAEADRAARAHAIAGETAAEVEAQQARLAIAAVGADRAFFFRVGGDGEALGHAGRVGAAAEACAARADDEWITGAGGGARHRDDTEIGASVAYDCASIGAGCAVINACVGGDGAVFDGARAVEAAEIAASAAEVVAAGVDRTEVRARRRTAVSAAAGGEENGEEKRAGEAHGRESNLFLRRIGVPGRSLERLLTLPPS